MDLCCGFFLCVCVELFQMFLPSSTVEKSWFSYGNFKFFKKMGGNPASPNLDSPQPTFQYHRPTTELGPWPQIRPTDNRAAIVKCLKSTQDTIADLVSKYA